MRNFLFICLGLNLLLACAEEPDCDLGVSPNSAGVKFYNKEDSTDLFVKFIGVFERGSDSIFYTSDDSLSLFTLNLNPMAEQVTYVFQSSTSVDTLTLSYVKQLEWLSETCGPSFMYGELDVIGSSFTYAVGSTFIDVSIDENVKIYN